MNRPTEHLISYIFAEYGTQGSVDGSGRLIIKGKFTQKQIEGILRSYICTSTHMDGWMDGAGVEWSGH